MEKNIKKLCTWQMSLNFDISEFPELDILRQEIRPVI